MQRTSAQCGLFSALHERSQRRLAKSPLASDKRSDREQVKLILEFAAGFGFRVVHRPSFRRPQFCRPVL